MATKAERDVVDVAMAALTDGELEAAIVFVRWFKDICALYEDSYDRTSLDGLTDKSLYRFVDAAMKPLVDQGVMPEFLAPGLTTSEYSHILLDALSEALLNGG